MYTVNMSNAFFLLSLLLIFFQFFFFFFNFFYFFDVWRKNSLAACAAYPNDYIVRSIAML